MFTNNQISINAVTGTIVKNYKDSFFISFHLESPLANTLLRENPYIRIGNHQKPVVVLQVMACGDMEVIAEVILKEDFDKEVTE